MGLVPGTNMPLGPGFGSINDLSGVGPATGGAFPTAPPPMGPQGLGNMVGMQLGPLPQAPAHLFQPTPIQQSAPPLAAPPAAPPPPAPAAPTSGFGLQPSALSDLSSPNALNPSGNLAFGMANWGGMISPQARDLYRNSQFQQPGGGYNNPGLQTLINPQAQNTQKATPSLFGLGGL